MSEKSKNILTIALLVLALFQGPYFYYFCDGLQIIIEPLYLVVSLYLTVYLLIKLLKYRATNSLYHIIGIITAIVIGVLTLRGGIVEYLDFKLRKQERMAVIKQVIDGKLIPDTVGNRHKWTLPDLPFFYISKRNQVDVDENQNGKVIVKFYTYLGYLDHDSQAFLYTNDHNEIQALDKKILNDANGSWLKKLDDNWYQIKE